MRLFLITSAVLLINIPFGYWRASVKKFSLQWFLAVHLPVPVVILLRIYGKIGFAFYTYIFLVGAFFGGQQIGAYLKRNKNKFADRLTPSRDNEMKNYSK